MYQIIKQIIKTGIKTETPPQADEAMRLVEQRLQQEILDVFGGALAIRQVDAGSCNGCELEIHAVNNAYYNIEGLGIKFVASPRHADLLLVTGPVSKHMEIALKRTYEATPEPKLVVAVGECACDGGIFGESYASCGKVSNVIPVDVAVSGCPPTPTAILQGILTAISAKEVGKPAWKATSCFIRRPPCFARSPWPDITRHRRSLSIAHWPWFHLRPICSGALPLRWRG